MNQFPQTTLTFGAIALLATQPVLANEVQVKDVQLSPTAQGIDILLDTESNTLPQIITINRGNSWVAEISNTRLSLAKGSSFHRDHPAPGIASLTIIPLDSKTIQAIVTGEKGAPVGKVEPRSPTGIRLRLSNSAPNIPSNVPATIPVTQPQPANSPTTSPNPFQPALPPEIEDVFISAPGINPNQNNSDLGRSPDLDPASAQRLFPQATVPPVGDIAINTINIPPQLLDIGTEERVPALVLRDAPVREVLSVLAATAGLNTVFVQADDPDVGSIDTTISMEIRNESVNSVFNYVLQVARLQANRVGNTILIGNDLPPAARGLLVRTLRLNQLKVTIPETEITSSVSTASSTTSGGSVSSVFTGGEDNANTGLGSVNTNSQITRSNSFSQKVPVKGALEILEELGANAGETQPNQPARRPGEDEPEKVLGGLQAIADSRTNTVTLIGQPNLVGVAIDYLRQLDVRRRQVSINVRIIEIDLDNEENIGASFSFGIDDSFFSVNQGQANLNFGELNPRFIPDPDSNSGSLFSPDIIQSPLNPDGDEGITRPLQFPRNFLLNIQARIQSNDAKVLTDPTLIVQEGSSSQVNLTSQVFAGFRDITEPAPGNEIRTVSETRPPIDVGVILNVFVEHIDDHGFVSLSVSSEVSSPGERITDPSRDDLLIQQLVNRRRLETGNIRLRNGQTLILTGIIQEADRTITTKTPLLGDIPLVGRLFRRTTDEHERNEVIVLVTPNVID